jgi:hypothetical protein
MAWVAIGVAGIGAAVKIGTGAHQNHLANEINPQFNQYKASPYAKQQLGTAQQMFNGRMPGANDIYNGIQANQSNIISNINRNATDSGQALALATGTQGNTNNAITNLGIQEGQYKASMLNNLNAGYQAMIGEGDKEYNSMFQKYQTDVGQQQGLRNAGMQNISGGVNDVASGISTGLQAKQQNDFNSQLLALYNPTPQPLNRSYPYDYGTVPINNTNVPGMIDPNAMTQQYGGLQLPNTSYNGFIGPRQPK